MPFHVLPDEFERIAAQALELVPAPLRERMEADNLMIVIQSQGQDEEDGVDERVLGFYQGQSTSAFSAYDYPKRIVLLQRHIENWCSTHAQLVAEVTDTVLHEVAHYFGMSHDDIRQTRLRH